jgi:hypothetical protein
MLKIKNHQARLIFGEILDKLDKIEVRGDSVEYLYIVRVGLKQITDSLEEIPDDKKELEEKKPIPKDKEVKK